MSDRSVGPVIDRNQYKEAEVETGVRQGPLVSSVLFAIYLSNIFREVEKVVEGSTAASFADNCEWLVTTELVEQLCQRLESLGIKRVE